MKRNFIRACDRLGIAPEKTLVIGDSLWSDIFGGQRNNMKTALVKNVVDEGQDR
jgi:predicted HAD superfamily phosphohydrolase YqeG